MNTLADVWARVPIRRLSECWEWQGARNHRGYGQMRLAGRQVPAHRVAYAVARGVDPGELHVLHRCDNPPCCNPFHLFLGTTADNNRDRAAKGRFIGSAHGGARLDEERVAAIRERYRDGEQGKVLAAEYGVTPALVSQIVNNRIWRHV